MKKHNAVVYGLMSLLLVICVPICAYLSEIDSEHAQAELIKTLEMRFCYISFVRIGNKEYIVKQKKSDYLRKIVSVVRDCITSHVAESYGIAHGIKEIAHRVTMIPAGTRFPGKVRTDWPATIHTIAPGDMIKAQDSPYDSMKIKQADIGFQRPMLHWMAKHPVLLLIVALDTFLCNHDRHRGNLFYNPKKDSFCAIDMDSSFKHNLCALGCKNFTEMLNDKRLKLSAKEIKTLQTYNEYLQFLIDTYHPEDTVAMYDYFAQRAGFVPGQELYTQKVALEMENNKRIIKESYKDAQRLVGIIEQVIQKAKKAL